MPNFKIYGADARSGDDVSVTLQAEDPREAEAIASHRRIMVSRIVEIEMAQPSPPPASRKIQTIEATGKEHKATVAIGIVVIFVGVFLTPLSGSLAFFVGLAGFVTMFVGAISGWWEHG